MLPRTGFGFGGVFSGDDNTFDRMSWMRSIAEVSYCFEKLAANVL